MRGKNKGKTRPKKATKATKRANLSSSSSPESDAVHEHSSPDVTDHSLWVTPRPRMVAGDLDLFAVTSGLPPSLKDLISKGVSHSALPPQAILTKTSLQRHQTRHLCHEALWPSFGLV